MNIMEKTEKESEKIRSEKAEEDDNDDFFHHLVYFYIGKVSPVPLTVRSYVCGLWNVPVKPHTLIPSEEPICLYPNQTMRIVIPDPKFQVFLNESQSLKQGKNYKENHNGFDSTIANTSESRRKETRHARKVIVRLCQYLRWTAQHNEKVEVETWSFTEPRTNTNTTNKAPRGRPPTTSRIDYESNVYNGNNSLDKKIEKNNAGRIPNTEGNVDGAFELDKFTNSATNAAAFQESIFSVQQENQKRHVIINVPGTIRPSSKGKLIEVYHELIVSVMNDIISETVAKSQNIPVHIVLPAEARC